MLLKELFSPIGAPNDQENDINWHEDLKVFIDNDNEVMSNVLFPAIKKHEKYRGHPDAYKLYIKPVESCCDMYCKKFDVQKPEEKFSRGNMISLARQIAKEQEGYLRR